MLSHQLHPSHQLATSSLSFIRYHLPYSSNLNSLLIIMSVLVCCYAVCITASLPEAAAELRPGQTPCMTVLTGLPIPAPTALCLHLNLTALSLHPNPHSTVSACQPPLHCPCIPTPTVSASQSPMHRPCIPIPTALSLHAVMPAMVQVQLTSAV